MDDGLISIIKQEKQKMLEDDNDNYLQLYFDIKVKIENDSMFNNCLVQNVLSPNNHETNYDKLTEHCKQFCVICKENFSDSYSLYKHNLIHLKVSLIEPQLFICDGCPNFYTKKNDLQVHIMLAHRPKQHNSDILVTKSLHKCQICEKTYAYKSWFEHIRNVHGQFKIECDQCSRTFKCERYLKRHIMYNHNGIKPSWRYHKVKSSNIDTYIQCDRCTARFINNSSLNSHIRNCHSEKKFKCKMCKSILKSKSYLLTHLKRVHYDDGKLHHCDICGKAFKSPRYVKVHIKNMHSFKNSCKN